MRPRSHYVMAVALTAIAASIAATEKSPAAILDFTSGPLTWESNAVSVSADGVVARATAYHVEFHDGISTIYGPFTTNRVSAIDQRQIFGTQTASGQFLNPGLGLLSLQDLGQSDRDACCALAQPGFDNTNINGIGSRPVLQFALFEFNTPVTVSQVTVDGVSNHGRSIWVAGGSVAPDLSLDLVNAFAGFTVLNLRDTASMGLFVHTFSPLNNIRWLAVGTPPRLLGNIGPFTERTGSSQFYVNQVSATPVPVPAAWWFFGSGLATITGITRRRRMRSAM